jgi:hypothetical protein
MSPPTNSDSSRLQTGLTALGWITIAASLVALVLGLVLVESLADDLRATTTLSRTAVGVIGDTIQVLDDAAGEIDESLDAAVGSVERASSTASAAATGLEEIADFLDGELPTQLESVHQAMPAAIQAAATIDGALSALSLLGVDYAPEEPFDVSLQRVEAALAGLPDELRTQSQSIRDLAPEADGLAGETQRLAEGLAALQEDLGSLQDLTVSYQTSVDQAEATIANAESSLDGSAWLLRGLIAAAAIAGLAVGSALVLIARSDRVGTMSDRDLDGATSRSL